MLKYLSLLILLLFPTSLRANIYHSISSSVQLEVHAAGTNADRIGNSYSISGTGVNTTDGTTAGSLGGLGSAVDNFELRAHNVAAARVVVDFLAGVGGTPDERYGRRI